MSHIHHGVKSNLITIGKSQMLTPFMSKIKLIQTSMELLLNKLKEDLIDTCLRGKVNGIVILSHTLKCNSSHLEKQQAMFNNLIINITNLPLNKSKNIESRLILRFCHMLSETMHGTSSIMITPISISTWLMDQKNTPLKLITICQTQLTLLVLQIHLSLAQLPKKLNLLTKKLLPNLKVSQLQNHGANLLLLMLILMILQVQMILLLILMREPVQMLLLVEMILPTLLLQLIQVKLLTKNKRLMFLIINNPSNIRFKLKLKLKIPQSLPKRSIKR